MRRNLFYFSKIIWWFQFCTKLFENFYKYDEYSNIKMPTIFYVIYLFIYFSVQ